jgi:hypothetical protein
MVCNNYGDCCSVPNACEDAAYKSRSMMPIEDHEPSYAPSDLPEPPDR